MGQAVGSILSWPRSEKDQLEKQLREQQAEVTQLQKQLTEEQKVRARLETVLAQATSLLQEIVQVSSGGGRGQGATRAKLREFFPERHTGQTPFLILDPKDPFKSWF